MCCCFRDGTTHGRFKKTEVYGGNALCDTNVRIVRGTRMRRQVTEFRLIDTV